MGLNVGEVGNFFKTTTQIDYRSNRNFLDFDLLIINMNAAANSLNLDHDFAIKKKDQLEDFLLYKKIPIIFFTPKESLKQLSNQFYDLHYLFPIPVMYVSDESGEKFKIQEHKLFKPFFEKYKSYISFHSVLKFDKGVPLITTLNKKPVSTYNPKSLFIPQLNNGIYEHEKDFLSDLYDIVITLQKDSTEYELPKWSYEFLLPSEKEIVSDVSNLKSKLMLVQEQVEQKEKELSLILEKKILFTGTGDNLEWQVKEIFVELGFDIIPARENRDDLIIKRDAKIAVVEIKGLKGSGKEENAAQLEKWVSGYYEENKIEPKGILIVNGFREQNLNERIEPVWPNQMLKYSKRKGLCLITGLQLLGIYFKAIEAPEQKEILIESLFNTVGVYKDFADWNSFITNNESKKL